jgi:hypothetical protein
MLTGYLLVMGYLALGLRILRQGPGRTEQRPRRPAARPAAPLATLGLRRWFGLIRQVAGTVIGGFLLLMVVVFGYYYGVAGLGGRFLLSALTGAALLVGIAVPLFFTTSWIAERWRNRPSGAAARKRVD